MFQKIRKKTSEANMNRNFDPKRKIIEMQLWKNGGKVWQAIPSRKHRTSVLHVQTHSKVIWDQVDTSFTSTRAPFTKWTSLSLLEISENLYKSFQLMLVTLTHRNLIASFWNENTSTPFTHIFYPTQLRCKPLRSCSCIMKLKSSQLW